jgi:hypothetical protein
MLAPSVSVWVGLWNLALAQSLPPNPVPVPNGPLPAPLLLSKAKELLTPNYPKMEVGYVKLSDGLYYVASKLYKRGESRALILGRSKHLEWVFKTRV